MLKEAQRKALGVRRLSVPGHSPLHSSPLAELFELFCDNFPVISVARMILMRCSLEPELSIRTSLTLD